MSSETLLPQAISLAVHEFRTPMTVVAGYLRMLLKEQAGPLTEKQRHMLEEAERSCGRLSRLVAELSEFGKLEAGTLAVARQPFDLNALVHEVASNMHEGSDRGVTLAVHAADSPVMVTGDRGRIGQVVHTLLFAALRERGEPGVVSAVVTTIQDTTPPWAVLAVGDEARLDELMRSARVTPPPLDEWRGGLGMALPVARRVLTALEGAVWSVGDQGRSGLALRLPLGMQDKR